jgi:predicted nucleic acid-binding protein
MSFYVDTSAAAKLVARESETVALARWLRQHEDDLWSSDLARTELVRLARRAAPQAVGRARIVLDSLTLLTLSTDIFERAAVLDPPELRGLDALHLAAALQLGDRLDGIVTYDERLSAAAGALGLAVIAPGSSP